MNTIRSRINEVRARLQKQWLWQCLSWGLVFGGLAGCLMGLLRIVAGDAIPWFAIAGAIVVGPLAGLLYFSIRPRLMHEAAALIDRQCGLKDRVVTALAFMAEPRNETPIRQLQIADAEAHITNVDPARVVRIQPPPSWRWGIGLTAAAALAAFWTAPRQQAVATVVANDVVTSQAERLMDDLAELKEFNQNDTDPETERMIHELAAKIDELKHPGIDPKEALAKLSDMETILQDKQQQLSQQDTKAPLAQVGEALALAESFASVGRAMSRGQWEQAAEELAKLELPQLDRKTERAVTEKLDLQANQSHGHTMPRSLRESIEQVSEGITQGNRGKFREGVAGLASACQSQGRRNKLVSLLRKQSQALGECKAECEREYQNIASGNQNGGKNWGLARSDNQPGEPTPQLKTGDEMKLTGQDSGRGDTDVETLSDHEHAQAAMRRYREQFQKYEQLAESALESEPIPLGHRQTIRRYFEMIRPQPAETDEPR